MTLVIVWRSWSRTTAAVFLLPFLAMLTWLGALPRRPSRSISTWRARGLAVGLAFAGVACAGGQTPPPSWFTRPPSANAGLLYFVGESTQAPERGTARDLAVQKAIASLTQYCGATVKSDFSSVERETNGQMEQMVALTVDVSGEELTLREAVIEETLVQPGSAGGFDGYALVRWPRARYDEVLQMQQARAQRALQVFLEAEVAFTERRVADTRQKLSETMRILGATRAQVALGHSRFAHTGLLFDASIALGQRLEAFERTRRGVMAVGLDCRLDGATRPCLPQHVGQVRERVTRSGIDVSANGLSPALARAISDAGGPTVEADVRDSGYVLAVTFDARSLGSQDGFVFARCGARAVVFDTDGGRIVGMTEVKPSKGGHVHLDGAVEKACEPTAGNVDAWLERVLPGVKEEDTE